jgi:hypothetical protein
MAPAKHAKYVSKLQEFHFLFRRHENGKPASHDIPESSALLPTFDTYSFTKVLGTRDPKTNKVDPESHHCFFIVDPDKLGDDYQRMIDTLNKFCTQPEKRMYTEADFFKLRNPEAYAINQEKVALTSTIEQQKAKIEELEKRLGFAKKN